MARGEIMEQAPKTKRQRVSEAAVEYAATPPPATAGQHEYLSLLGLRSFDTASLLKRLDEGLSYAAFERLKRRLKVTSQELADAALITQRTLARRKKAGRMQPDESDRLVRVSRVFARAIELFEGDAEGARSWLMRPVWGLGGAIPFDMVKTEVGALEVERLISRLEHGVLS
jgi:putative toxin-antitoxin system antitoxin component (TIGR02293 family)